MLFSKTAKQTGGTGIFFDGDKNAPSDSVTVALADVTTVINLPAGASYDFDTAGVLVITDAVAKTAAEMRAEDIDNMWSKIKTERDRRRFNGGVEVGDYWFLTTATATGEYVTLQLLASGQADTVVLRDAWRTMSGETVLMTVALVKEIVPASFAKVVATDDAALAHKAAMEALADPSTYDYSGGWPKVFGE